MSLLFRIKEFLANEQTSLLLLFICFYFINCLSVPSKEGTRFVVHLALPFASLKKIEVIALLVLRCMLLKILYFNFYLAIFFVKENIWWKRHTCELRNKDSIDERRSQLYTSCIWSFIYSLSNVHFSWAYFEFTNDQLPVCLIAQLVRMQICGYARQTSTLIVSLISFGT